MNLLTEFFTSIPDIFLGWVLPIIFVLTLVVFFHELGHFLVARWCGVDVEVFSIGFGKEIIGFNDSKNTRWKFCWLPLGGYVKFAGDASAASTPDNEAMEQQTEQERAGSFHHKALWKRALVVLAGPVASFILGIVIFAGINYSNTQQGPTGLVDKVIEGGAAEAAGIQVGDIITHINGEETKFFANIYRIVSMGAQDKLIFSIKRGDQTSDIEITPRQAMVDNGFGKKISLGRIGIGPSADKNNWLKFNHTPSSAMLAGINQTKFIVTSTLSYIGKIFTGKESTDKLNGPIGIGKIVNQFSSMGITSTFYIAALLSVSIGLFNLFPIPLLDGGHLMFYIIEAIRGRPASDRFMEYSFRAGLALLLGLMLIATKNDISWFN